MAQPCDTMLLCLYQLAASLRWLTEAPFSLLLPRRASQAAGSAPVGAGKSAADSELRVR